MRCSRMPWAVLIEDKANGSAVIETLAGEIPGVLAIQPDGGKVARAYALQPEQEAGCLHLPASSVDADIETFLSEASSFPGSPNDDEIDAMSQYVNWARKRSKTGGLAEWIRAQYGATNGRAPAGAA